MIENLPSIDSILLTTDLSTDAASAYGLAASLTHMYGGHLTVLSCIDTSSQYSDASLGTLEAPTIIPPQAVTNTYADVENALQECIAAHFDSARTDYHIVQAPVAVKQSIVSFSQEKKNLIC